MSSSSLVLAAKAGSFSDVLSLYAAGASLHHESNEGDTALLWAAVHNHRPMLQFLLDHQVSVNFANSSGETALMLAILNRHAAIVARLLAHGADPNCADEEGWTPLHHAASRGWGGLVQRLLAAGADRQRRTLGGDQALDLATTEAVRALLAG
jgi:cytohesin